jgi:dihydroxyacetone kinase
VLLNGLGSTKYEELFVLWHHLLPRLHGAGLDVVAPLVGELATSLDMAGCSLTVTWLDADLERYLLAPADAPAFRRGSVAGRANASAAGWTPGTAGAAGTAGAPATTPSAATLPDVPPASSASQVLAGLESRCLAAMHASLTAAEAELGALDSWAGDGDHGRGMVRGSSAAAAAAASACDAGAGARTTLLRAGDAWADRGGGTSGALWGEALRAFAGVLDDQVGLEAEMIVTGARVMLNAVARAGGAKPGDKTMLDAMLPYVDALEQAVGQGVALVDSLRIAAARAAEAAQATAGLSPRIGRARPLAERSVGHPDPGAVSFAICAAAIVPAIAEG